MANYMLTTVDNPFDPFTQFDRWYDYDQEKGYKSLELLARIAHSSSDLSEEDQDLEILRAIDEIVFENILGIYRKIEPQNNKDPGD